MRSEPVIVNMTIAGIIAMGVDIFLPGAWRILELAVVLVGAVIARRKVGPVV